MPSAFQKSGPAASSSATASDPPPQTNLSIQPAGAHSEKRRSHGGLTGEQGCEIHERDGVAAQVLVRRGINLDRAGQQVIELLSSRPREVPPTGGSASREGEETIAASETEEAKGDDEIGRLRREIERLRALLRAHDIDPGTSYGD